MVNAVNPKYASVFPPPVGNQIKSTISLSGQSSLYIELRFNKINANWKGLHLPYTFFSLLYQVVSSSKSGITISFFKTNENVLLL